MKLKLTKIVATIAGNSCNAELITALAERGMNVVRFNTAHMSVEELENAVKVVRSVSPYLAILVDTKGPNIRTCGITSPLHVKKGEQVLVSGCPIKNGFSVNYEPFADEVPVGSRIVCDDGAAAFEVVGKKGKCLKLKALFNSVINDRKSINVPNVSLKAPALTDKDKIFLKASVEFGIDFIAHSFVRSAADVEAVREALGEAGKDIAIIAKIENREGVDNLDSILEVADGIMVARGDLGIEIPLEEIPSIQKMMIRKCMEMAKPVITATQMLQSMESSPLPTRAEVSDVANAVYDGTDAVMLSGETAHGKFPCEAVEMMNRIVTEAESAPAHKIQPPTPSTKHHAPTTYILNAAIYSCDYLPVKAIICSTLSGRPARICSATRKHVPIIAATPKATTLRQLALSYGVFPALTDYSDDPIEQAGNAIAVVKDILHKNDLVMIVGKHSSAVHRSNMCCLAHMQDIV